MYIMQYSSGITVNEVGTFVEMWMDLESVMQTQVSEKDKNIIYECIYMKSRKMARKNYLQGRNREAYVENRHGCSGVRGEWDELGEEHRYIYTTRCK